MTPITEHEPPDPPDPAETSGRVQRLVHDGYRLLADLHDVIGHSGADPAMAREHLDRATRELAEVQKMFERRGHD